MIYLSARLFDVGRSVHHYTIQINYPTTCNIFTSLLFDVYMSFNVFRAPPRPSSGAYNCINSLWFYRWNVVVAALLVVVWPENDQQRCYHQRSNGKTRGCYPLRTMRPVYRTDVPLPSRCCILCIFFFSTNIRTEFFKHAAHSLFFSSKCPFIS